MDNTAKWGRAKARQRYADGGNIEPLRISLNDMADRMDRMKKRGVLDEEAGKNFAAARMNRMGIDPVKYIGRQAPYSKGGKAK